MKIPWTNSKWRVDDLNFRSVEFQLPMPGKLLQGIGQFLARQNPEGQIAVEILCDGAGSTAEERIQTRITVPAAGVDRIERHPDPPVALFRLHCS